MMQKELAEGLYVHYMDPGVVAGSLGHALPAPISDAAQRAHELADNAKDAVISGIRGLLQDLKGHKGRYTSGSRITQENLKMSASLTCATRRWSCAGQPV